MNLKNLVCGKQYCMWSETVGLNRSTGIKVVVMDEQEPLVQVKVHDLGRLRVKCYDNENKAYLYNQGESSNGGWQNDFSILFEELRHESANFHKYDGNNSGRAMISGQSFDYSCDVKQITRLYTDTAYGDQKDYLCVDRQDGDDWNELDLVAFEGVEMPEVTDFDAALIDSSNSLKNGLESKKVTSTYEECYGPITADLDKTTKTFDLQGTAKVVSSDTINDNISDGFWKNSKIRELAIITVGSYVKVGEEGIGELKNDSLFNASVGTNVDNSSETYLTPVMDWHDLLLISNKSQTFDMDG